MPRDNRCMYMAHVCFYVCCSDCARVCGNICCVAAVVKNCGFLSLGVLKYVVCLCRGCDGCCVFCLYCEALSCRCSCMGSVNVSSCRCCMFVSCVHPVAVLNAAFCMTCSLLMLVEDAIGDHTEEAYSRYIASIAQLVSALDFNFERAVEGSILTAGKRLSLKNLNVIIRAIN